MRCSARSSSPPLLRWIESAFRARKVQSRLSLLAKPTVCSSDCWDVASRTSMRVDPFHSGLAVYSIASAIAMFSFWLSPESACTRSMLVPTRNPSAIGQRLRNPMATSESPPESASRMRYSLKRRASLRYSVSSPKTVAFWRCWLLSP